MSGLYGNSQNKTEYILISDLAPEFGYDTDHISRLCRQGKIDSLRESNGRWHATRESLIAYQESAHQVKQEIAAKNLIPRSLAPSSSLRISDRMPGRVNLGATLKTASKFALLGIFVFAVSFSFAAFAKNNDFKNNLKKLGNTVSNLGGELVSLITPPLEFKYDGQQLIFRVGSGEFLNFKKLENNFDLALYDFQTLSQNYQSNFFTILSPLLSPIEDIVAKFRKEPEPDKIAQFEKQISELKNQLDEAKLQILSNASTFKTSITIREPIREIQEKRIVTEKKIVTAPSNIETRLLSIEQNIEEGEEKFRTIEIALAGVSDRFSYTPTILVTSGGGGSSGATVNNAVTTDSQTVKAITLDVSEDATIARNFTVDTNTFYVNAADNRIGIGTRNLETALELSGAASVSSDLYVLGRLGIGTVNPTTKLEVQGTASASYLLSANTLQVAGNSSVSYSRFGALTTSHSNYVNASNDVLVSGDLEVKGTASFAGVASVSGNLYVYGNIGIGTSTVPNQLTVIGSGSFTGQLKATRNPTVAHTGTWPDFTNTNDATLYVNPSSPVADGNVIAYVSNTSPKFVVDAEGDIFAAGNLTLVGTTTQATTNVTGDISVEGNTRLGDAIGDKIKFPGTVLPYTLSSFPLLIKASASQTVDLFRIRDSSDNTVLTVDQGTGLITASSGFNFTLGFSTATTSYSRLGTNTTGYSSDIDKFNDLLISGALEVDGNSFLDGKASISGNFQTAGRFILGDNGDTGEINTSDWDISSTGNLSGIGTIAADGAYTQTGTGANTFSGATTFSSTGLALLTSAGRAEFQGTASASYLLTGNTLQAGGFASAAYSRFGTATATDSAINTTNDLLISGALEVDDILRVDGTGTHTVSGLLSLTNASVSGNFELTGSSPLLGINPGAVINTNLEVGGTASISGATTLRGVTYTWPSADGANARFLQTNGSGSLSWAQSVTSNSLDFDEFVNSMTLDANLTVASGGFNITITDARTVINNSVFTSDTNRLGINTTSPVTILEVQGTASASYLLTGNTLQVGGYSSAAYSRFGTDTTGYSSDLDASNDLLISGALEVNGNSFLDGSASVAGRFELTSSTARLGINAGSFTDTMLEVGGTASISGTTTLRGITYTWPSADGSSNQFLRTNGSGSLVWATGLVGSNSLDFDELVNSMTLDANLTVASAGFNIDFNDTQISFAGGRITTGGNVGVGTTNPLAPLHVLGQCVTGDTRLRRRRKKKNKNEKDKFDETPIKDIKPGDEILTLNEKTGKLVYQKVNALMDMGIKPIYKLTTESGKTIRTTGSHPYLVLPAISNKFGTPVNWSGFGKTLVVIDAANLEQSVKERGWWVDYRKLYSFFRAKTELIQARYYTPRFNTENQDKFLTVLKKIGFKLVTKTLKVLKEKELETGHTRKANFDVEIALDAIKRVSQFNTLILFSGDSDFAYLVQKIRDEGKKVIVVSSKYHVAKELIETANHYLDIKKLKSEIQRTAYKNDKARLLQRAVDDRLESQPAESIVVAPAQFVNRGRWTKVSELKIGQMIAVAGETKAVWDKIVKIERLPAEQVYDIEVEGTHNFVGNDIVAHNTFITGRTGINTTAPSTTLEVQGTASASYLLTGNTLQVGGYSSAAYSRFGTDTTGYSSDLDASNDLLISGALEVNGNSFLDGSSSVAGRFELTSSTARLGINAGSFTDTMLEVGGTASISGTTTLRGVTYTWPSADGSSTHFLQTNGSGTLSWASGRPASNTLDFDEIVNSPTLDANLNIQRAGYLIGIGGAPSTVFEVQGTASASYLLTGNTLQVGGFASVAYSRFGTSTTGHSNYISTTNDVLVSGDLEVDGSISAQFASASQMFIMNPTASASLTFRGNGSGGANQSRFSLGIGNGTERLNIFNDVNSPIVTIASTGAVGIGTTAPSITGVNGFLTIRDPSGPTIVNLVTGDSDNSGNDVADINWVMPSNTGAADTRVASIFGVTEGATANNRGANLRFYTKANAGSLTERMRIDSSGNVGIGTATVGSQLHLYQSTTDTTEPGIKVEQAGTGDASINFNLTGAINWSVGADNSDLDKFKISSATDLATSNALTIDTSGNVGIGTTAPGAKLHVAGRFSVNKAEAGTNILGTIGYTSATEHGLYLDDTNTGADGGFPIRFRRGSGLTVVGDITTTTTTTAYNTSSDLRLKENITPTSLGLETLSNISVNDFNFIQDPNKMRVQGFIAQELYKYYPDAVTVGGEDPAQRPWTVDYGRLTPLLVKSVQELNDRSSAVYTASDVSEGDLVAFGSEAETVKWAEDGNVIGVVSGKSETGSTSSPQANSNDQNSNIETVRVAFSGRAEVNVTEENGPIKAGDRLTVSKTKPGYAMKQTEAGQSIGIALENSEMCNVKLETSNTNQQNSCSTLQASSSKILAFVNLSYWAPADAITNFQSLIFNTASSSFSDSASSSSSSPTLSLNSFFSFFLNQFKQLGVIFENGALKVAQIITDKLTTKELCLEDICVNKEQLKQLLEKNQIAPAEEPVTANVGVFKQKFCLDDVCITKEQFRTLLEKNGITNQESGIMESTQEPTPTPLPSESPISTPEATSEPSPESTPTPTLTPESSPEITPEPTPEPTPSPEPEPAPKTNSEISPESIPAAEEPIQAIQE